MTEQNTQIATQSPQQITTTGDSPFALRTWDDVKKAAEAYAESQLYGLKKPAQHITLMAMAHEQGVSRSSLMDRIYLSEDGKIIKRSDFTLAEIERRGATVLWHVRSDEMVSATFFKKGVTVDEKTKKRAKERFVLLWELECLKPEPEYKDDDDDEIDRKREQNDAISQKRSVLLVKIGDIAEPGEETILRTFADALEKGLATKAVWQKNKRQMLTARVITEGASVIDPSVNTGTISEFDAEFIRIGEREEREQAKTSLTNKLDTWDPVKLSEKDKDAIREIMAKYREEAKTASPARKSELQGLASELQCKLDDADVIDTTPKAREVHAEVLPTMAKEHPGDKDQGIKTALLPTEHNHSEAAPELKAKQEEKTEPLDWREVEIHIGNAAGGMLGKKVGDVFKEDLSEKRMESLMKHFGNALASQPGKRERDLLDAINAAHQNWKDHNQQTEPAQKQATETPTEAPQTTAPATDWRSHIVKSKNASRNGRRLDDFTREEIVEMKETVLDKMDSTKLTADNKKLIAMVALALAELSDPRETICDRLQEAGIGIMNFTQTAKEQGWIEGERIADMTTEEANTILSDWETVLKAFQPK